MNTTPFDFSSMASGLNIKVLSDLSALPQSPGVYLLFTASGAFIYVGKATDLRSRISDHFSPKEENMKIKLLAHYFIYEVHPSINAAEDAEGAIYDSWVDATGAAPLANEIAPPKSKASHAEKARIILERLRDLMKK